MSTYKETQALIAKEITISLVEKIRIPGPAQAPYEQSNATLRTEVCKIYEEVFNTVKRSMEE